MPTNGYDADELARYLEAIDREDGELDTLKSQHREACKGPRERIKETIEAASEAGINATAFRAVLAQRRIDRRQQQRIAELEQDDVDAYDLMMLALGGLADTPLGQAALERVRPQGDGETLDNL